MIISHPEWLLVLIVAIPATLGLWSRHARQHPMVFLFKELPKYTMLRMLPLLALMGAEVAGAFVLARPQQVKEVSTSKKVQGRDFFFALDFSPSMGELIEGELPQRRYNDPFFDGMEGRREEFTHEGVWRIDAAQTAILNIIDVRCERQEKLGQSADEMGDAYGLIVFDHKPRLVWPLDRDPKQLRRRANFVPRTKGFRGLGWGTNFGTTIPGPIDMAAKYFNEDGQSTTRVLVIVSDGENDLKPEVRKRLIDLLIANRIKLYVIGVGGEIAKKEAEHAKAPGADSGVDIARVARAAGGKVFMVNSTKQMDACMDAIDNEESSPVPAMSHQTREELFGYPLALALVLTIVWAASRAILFGR